MRVASLLVGCVLAGPALAQTQIPIPPFGSTFVAPLTRGFWFQAPIGLTITGLLVPNESLQPNQVVEVIRLPNAPPAYPSVIAGTQLFYDNATAAGTLINCSIPVSPGDFIGILGACTPGQGSATSHSSYAGAAGVFTSNILGAPVTLTRFGTQSGIASNGGNQPCWEEPTGALARIEVYVSGGTGFADKVRFGAGCYDDYNSFFEHFQTTPSIDLSNSGMRMLDTGTRYVVVPSVAALLDPTRAGSAATNLGLIDDSETSVTLSAPMPVPGGTTTTLNVCSNGHVSTVSNGAAFDYTPTPGEMLNWANTTWAVWRDMIPNAAGNVWFEEVGGKAYITWYNVVGYVGQVAGTTPSTFQLQFELATGSVDFVFGSLDTTSVSGWAGGEGWVVGFSPGGISSVTTPGTDLSVAVPQSFLVPRAELLALAHDGSARPVIGTVCSLDTANVPANCLLGATLLGLAGLNPGIPLDGLGLPGCFLHVTIDASHIWLPAGGVGSTLFAIPNDPGLAGLEMNSQGAALVPGVNAAGAATSNGLKLTLDVN